MARSRDELANSVMSRIRDAELSVREYKVGQPTIEALRASAATTPVLGHPAFIDLPLGASGHVNAVAMFLDLRRFTARSFWDTPEEVLRVNVAVISELAAAVQQHGGHVLGFRGDGVFACFDGGDLDPRAVAGVAVGTAAWALDAVKNAVNELLEMSNIPSVQVRAGLDYGRLDFVRIGSPEGSEVNVLGFAANFAAKCEKAGKSWEVVVGESMAELLPDDDVSRHSCPPATYSRDGQTRICPFYKVDPLGAYLKYMPGVSEQLNGRPVSAIGVA